MTPDNQAATPDPNCSPTLSTSTTNTIKSAERMEPVILLLFVGMMVFTLALFACEKFFPADGQMFQVVAGLLTGFSGAFFMRVKPRTESDGKSETKTTVTNGQ